MAEFTIPEFITVHIGPPSQGGQNVTVPFADYIKNVASVKSVIGKNLQRIVSAFGRIPLCWNAEVKTFYNICFSLILRSLYGKNQTRIR